MIITTCENIPGQSLMPLGLVRGNVVWSKNIGRDVMASFKNIAGGDVKSYTLLTNEAREVAIQRMMEDAANLGADAITMTRFSESVPSQGMVEIFCYGTAVKFV